jgi:hypothetical protein
LFASFGLFAPPNLTSAVTLTLSALAVAGAVGIILELERGFGGLIHISPQPMLQAANALDKHDCTNETVSKLQMKNVGTMLREEHFRQAKQYAKASKARFRRAD